LKLHEIDTPALLVDLDAMERNLAKMARRFATGPTRLRPHYKNHKCPALARRQMEAGAIGLTCATLAEAEALVSNGFTDILISNELAGDRKVARFVELASRADVKTVVDNAEAVASIGAAARAKRCRPGVLVDVNVGHDRTGVGPGAPVAALARQVLAEGLRFQGLMGYEGHVGHQTEGPDKDAAFDRSMGALIQCRRLLEESGIPVEIVSAGGTGTSHLSSRVPGITESQAGSYLLMDTNYADTCQDFELTLTVLATVISKTEGARVVVDAGLKSISGERGLPLVKGHPSMPVTKLNAEHGIIGLTDRSFSPRIGDTLELWVRYSDGTVNLHDRMYCTRNGEVTEILKLQG
jgi:D-serine deaminase-like pyridoxal phosphate-dependent protein